MFLEIVSPESVLLSQNVQSVGLPGASGSFQVLNNHAPIVSTLAKGKVKIWSQKPISLNTKQFSVEKQGPVWQFDINAGIFEMKDNKAILLIE
ncbi:MAG: F0F1 ATP synthase subunit epsilon [Flavobacteriaceae bacterium]|nr:F0F1 ATP synthase subunit epsilon [Flavobacteriaceae bacterium]